MTPIWTIEELHGQTSIEDAITETETEQAAAPVAEPADVDAPLIETLDNGELGVILDGGPSTVVLTVDGTVELDLVPMEMSRAQALELAAALVAVATAPEH